MQRIVIRYGLIAVAISAICMGISCIFISQSDEHGNLNMIVGFAGMILTFSTIAMALRALDRENPSEPITYWKALQVGLLITLIASVGYVIAWKIYMTLLFPDFMARYAQHMIDGLNKSGQSAAAIAEQTKGIIEMRENYKNPLYFVGYTMMEIFPVGLLMSLILMVIYGRKKPKVV